MTERCSSFTDEPLPGTATTETGWLCIENESGWGRDPFSGETFAPEVGGAVERFAESRGLRVLLIRRPGRIGAPRGRMRVFVADSVPGRTALREFTVADYAEIPGLPLDDPAAGEPAGPIALVCTNGKRDVCCAVLGRPIAAALADRYTDPVVWECSHTGGHRFAPVLIVLPAGHTYGRVTEGQAQGALDAARAGVVATAGLRGRSSIPPAEQAAEVAVRELLGPVGPDVLRTGSDGGGAVTVRHEDGRTWRMAVTSEELPPRMMSCGKKPSPARAWRVTDLIADGN
ncbi:MULTISPECIES: sucrase ferredoxin [Tsukamurella]|uniref:Sucrase ferredoxin n=2 Tax=Tsukamurella TaxID=2060 RepID=A0A5C5S902_9ACTN|nr:MULTISPECIES: sucrase ferredoxin [Tsukamurella]NMD57546.1 sucrase ferredoxin [Tsukamurella columbiensis]TWS30945.1 sucrase ferredoxin [Tsukamurella conjunctivitidis]